MSKTALTERLESCCHILKPIFSLSHNPAVNAGTKTGIVSTGRPKMIYFGNTKVNMTGEVVSRDFSNSKRILVIGKTGDGKSVFANMIAGQFLSYGLPVEFVCDVKGQIWDTMKEPVQEKYRRALPPGLSPQGFDVRSYVPKAILNKKEGYGLRHEEDILEYSVTEIEFRDLVTLSSSLTRAASKGASSVDILETIWGHFNNNLFEFQEALAKSGEFSVNGEKILVSAAERKEISNALALIKSAGMVGPKGSEQNIESDLVNNKCIAINLRYKDSIKDSQWHSICAVELRRVLNYSSPLLLVIDEAHNLIMKNFWNAANYNLFKIMQEERHRGKSCIILGQTLVGSRTKNSDGRVVSSAVDGRVAKMCDFIFLTAKTSKEDRENLNKYMGNPLTVEEMDGKYNEFGAKLSRGVNDLAVDPKTGRPEWVLIDINSPVNNRLTFFHPYVSQCHVHEEGE